MKLGPFSPHWLRTTRSRLTLLFGGTAVITGLGFGLVVDQVLSKHLTDLSGQSLMNASQPIALALAQGIQEREREISLLSHQPLLTRTEGYAPQLQAHLEQIKVSYPFYSWIGVTDERGVVQVSTGNLLLGQDVSARPWFGAGKTALTLATHTMRCCWTNTCVSQAARCPCGSWTTHRLCVGKTRSSKG